MTFSPKRTQPEEFLTNGSPNLNFRPKERPHFDTQRTNSDIPSMCYLERGSGETQVLNLQNRLPEASGSQGFEWRFAQVGEGRKMAEN